MPGGLLQLIATGTEDGPLIFNPEMTFFKKVYKRHTNFSTYNDKINLGKKKLGSKFNYILPKKGDLINKIYLTSKFKINNIFKNTTNTQKQEIINMNTSEKIKVIEKIINFINKKDENWHLIKIDENKILINLEWELFKRYNLVENYGFLKNEFADENILENFLDKSGEFIKYQDIINNKR